MWNTIVSKTFGEWFAELGETAQDAVLDRVNVLRIVGPALGRPYADAVQGSRHRNAVLLCGGSKKGDKRFYRRMIATADRLFEAYLGGAE